MSLFFPPSGRRGSARVSTGLPTAVVLGVQLVAFSGLAHAQTAAPTDSQRIQLVADEEDGAADVSPLRVTIAQEAGRKLASPDRVIKNRSSLQVEYSKYLLENLFVEFNGKANVFLGQDHRRPVEHSSTVVPQAYVQTSFGQTSIKAGIQTLPWGESVLAPVTDEISPRDNRELFNFNLEELRIGQAMVVVDQFSPVGRWSAFYTPRASFNKNPERGSAYFFDPFNYRDTIEDESRSEYGGSWRMNFGSADLTLMAASLLENDYAVRLVGMGLATREWHRFSMAGVVVNYGLNDFVLRGEAAFKSSKAYNNAALQIVEKNAVDAYVAVDYRRSSSLTFSVEAVNQHIAGWDSSIAGLPRNRQSLLLSMTKLLMNDDLSINVLHVQNRPNPSHVTVLTSSLKWDDHLTLGLNAVYPHTKNVKSGLWNIRDQKQIGFKVQYQF